MSSSNVIVTYVFMQDMISWPDPLPSWGTALALHQDDHLQCRF